MKRRAAVPESNSEIQKEGLGEVNRHQYRLGWLGAQPSGCLSASLEIMGFPKYCAARGRGVSDRDKRRTRKGREGRGSGCAFPIGRFPWHVGLGILHTVFLTV